MDDRTAHVGETIRCRICGQDAACNRGELNYYVGFCWPVFDCAACGCLFTLHDLSVYDVLYKETGSCYNRYIGLSEAAKALFDRGDLAQLKAELSQSSKYRFIIEQIAQEPAEARLLEIGCSRGHLTSYFIIAKRHVTGVDVSPKAVAEAKASFGDHFVLPDDPSIEGNAPYDVIYHVGTIGCVADPIGMTRKLLGMLKPGGRLFFNSPNRDSCVLRDQLWLDSTPPPDLVTMYRPGFWGQHFGHVAEVCEQVEHESPQQSFIIGLQKLAGRRWRKPVPISLNESNLPSAPPPAWSDMLWRNIARVVRRTGPLIGIYRLVPPRPTEFGLFVKMRKK
jgi:SAM-dependent methyltransferase